MEEREVIELLRHSPIMDEAKKYKKEEKRTYRKKKIEKKKKNVQSKNIINQIVSKKKFPTFFTMFTSSEMF